MSINFQQPDLTLEKCGQSIALIPQLCSHFTGGPCDQCEGGCPLDIAIKAVVSLRKEYHHELAIKRQAQSFTAKFQNTIRGVRDA